MNFTDIPARILKAFGLNGQKNTIATDSSTSTDNNGVATYDKGFPPITMTPLSAGGIPPSGKDMNGILYALSLKEQWSDAGMSYPFNSDFATAISGYPKGSILLNSQQSGKWLNLTDGNFTSPESLTGASTGWVPIENYGVTSISGLASTNVTLTSMQAAKGRIVLTGTLTANIALIFPTWINTWTVVNNCTGNFTVTCRTASGGGVSVQTGTTAKVSCDGSAINAENPTMVSTAIKSTHAVNLGQFSPTLSNPGQQPIAGGLIIKWGEQITSSSTMSVTFDSPFANDCFLLFPTNLIESDNRYFFAQCTSRNKLGGQFAIYSGLNNAAPSSNVTQVSVGWLAIGY